VHGSKLLKETVYNRKQFIENVKNIILNIGIIKIYKNDNIGNIIIKIYKNGI